MNPLGKTAGNGADGAPGDDAGESAPGPIMECILNCVVSRDGAQAPGGETRASLGAANLALAPVSGEPLTVSLREIVALAAADYSISLELASGMQLFLSRLGHAYEDFVRELSLARSDVLLQDMLMQEKLLKRGVDAQYRLFEGDRIVGQGSGQVRVYETGLVLLPFGGEPVRVPFSLVAGVTARDYELSVATEGGETVRISRLGREFDPLAKAVADAMGALALRSQAAVKELLPLADAATVQKLARLMKDGRAARRRDVDAISPELWPGLETKLAAAGLGEEYRHLGAIARQDRLCIGYKKGLVKGDDYLWLLAPVYGDRATGNAIVMEAVKAGQAAGEDPSDTGDDGSAAGPGKATYLFRITGRGEYPGATPEALDAATDAAIRRINDGMLAINFRREPVYLPDDRLREPGYAKYLYSLRRLPGLRELRERFVGRILHVSPDQWKADLQAALAFNATAPGDDARWTKGT